MTIQRPWGCTNGQTETWGCANGHPGTPGTHYYDGDMQGAYLPVNQLQRWALVACVGNVNLLRGNPLSTRGRTHACGGGAHRDQEPDTMYRVTMYDVFILSQGVWSSMVIIC